MDDKVFIGHGNIREEGSSPNEMKTILMVIRVFKMNYLFRVVSRMR